MLSAMTTAVRSSSKPLPAVLLFADLEPLHPTVRLREGIRQLGLGVALLTVVEHGDLGRQRGVLERGKENKFVDRKFDSSWWIVYK